MIPVPPEPRLRVLLVGDGEGLRRRIAREDGAGLPGTLDVELVADPAEFAALAGAGGYDAVLIESDTAGPDAETIVDWCRRNRPDLPLLRVDREGNPLDVLPPSWMPQGPDRAGAALPAVTPAHAPLAPSAPVRPDVTAEVSVIFDAASDLMGSLDEQGRIEKVNRRALEFVGRSPEELVGTRFVDLLAEEERAAIDDCLRGLAEGQRARCDLHLGGAERRRIGWATLVAKPGGRGAIFVVNDVTALRQAQRRLQQDNQRLKQDRERLRILASVDDLTGLYNRRACQEWLAKCLDEVRAAGHPLTFVMIDLDHFKRINDTYGHPFGDQVLRRVGKFLREGIRSSDVAARYGGEEIALILPRAAEADAFRLVERLRERWSAEVFERGGVPVRVTFSAGLATYPGTGEVDGARLIQEADERLYQAKLEGRNRTVCASFGSRGNASIPVPGGSEAHRLAIGRLHALAEDFGRGLVRRLHFLTRSLEMKSPYAGRHGGDVMVLAHKLALGVGLSAPQADRLACAGYLHDVGLILVPEPPLNRPGPLTGEEWKMIRRHPGWGAKLLSEIPIFDEEPIWIAAHHERLDGGGYPEGLRGRDIPLGAQILGLADTFAAMTSDRPYHAAWTRERALSELERMAGSQFDRDLVHLLASLA